MFVLSRVNTFSRIEPVESVSKLFHNEAYSQVSHLFLLPLLGLCISDNNLTDAGLVPLVTRLFKCEHLKSFDLSHNKVDAATADALQGKYMQLLVVVWLVDEQ